jgi:hypothetical protein
MASSRPGRQPARQARLSVSPELGRQVRDRAAEAARLATFGCRSIARIHLRSALVGAVQWGRGRQRPGPSKIYPSGTLSQLSQSPWCHISTAFSSAK